MLLSVTLGRRFRPEYEALRRSFIHLPGLQQSVSTMRDRWDGPGRSNYLDVRLEGKVVGTARITRGVMSTGRPQCRGVIQDWTRGAAPLPCGRHVVDVSRVVNSDSVRGFGLYGAEFLLALALASQMQGVKEVCAIVKVDLEGPRHTLRRLGFVEVSNGLPLYSYDVPGQAVKVVAMRHTLSEHARERAAAVEHTLKKFRRSGVQCPDFEGIVKKAMASWTMA